MVRVEAYREYASSRSFAESNMKTGVPSLGGIARGKIERALALKRYLESPNICKQCGSVIGVGESQKVSQVRQKQFCNWVCAARFNNAGRKRTLPEKPLLHEKPLRVCLGCGIWFTAYKSKLRFCSRPCAAKFRSSCSEISSRTKQDLFASRKNWQSARSSIRRHAAIIWKRSGRKLECSRCGYSNYVEIAHLKAVSEFLDGATIGQINDLSNLIALCPNHHWEFDHLSRDSETASS